MPQVPVALRKERAARLRAAGDTAQARFFAGQIGGTVEVLVENGREGHTPHYAKVRLDGDAEPGGFVTARITGAEEENLTGTIQE